MHGFVRDNIKTMILIGIDEVGRGPLAGPVAVGIFLISKKNKNHKEIKSLFKVAQDSKKLTAQKREEIFKKIKKAEKDNILRYVVRYESSKVIDTRGISVAIRLCIEKGLKELKVKPKETKVFLDGGLKAPNEFIFQKTIIKGDQKEKIISLASIVAKVSRDSLMNRLSKKYPKYSFEVHKGYGTKLHRQAIKKYGASPHHRLSFCKNITKS